MPTIEQSTAPPLTLKTSGTFQGPRGHWLGGCLQRMRRDPLALYTQARRDYGDYVRLRVVPGFNCYVLTHPDAVEHVLLKGHKNYRKPDIFYKSVGLLVGDGLFTNEGESLAEPAAARPARVPQPIPLPSDPSHG